MEDAYVCGVEETYGGQYGARYILSSKRFLKPREPAQIVRGQEALQQAQGFVKRGRVDVGATFSLTADKDVCTVRRRLPRYRSGSRTYPRIDRHEFDAIGSWDQLRPIDCESMLSTGVIGHRHFKWASFPWAP
jgi:hypothetical protein